MNYWLILFLLPLSCFSQLVKDLDGDGIKDTVYIDTLDYKITCKLSTQKFRPIKSKEVLSEGNNEKIVATKNGFAFSVRYMRAGFENQFRYNTKTHKIQLIGMSRYEDGPATNDGSGESSVNLLTNDYIGEWNHYDLRRNKLVKMPTIKSKMYFPTVYLENYDAGYQSVYEEKCSALYYLYKKKMK